MGLKKLICILIVSLMLMPLLNISAFAVNYTVKEGDSLYKIGLKYGVSYERIMSQNSLRTTYITPGMILEIPNFVYTVKKDDSLFLIAQRFNTSVDALKSANKLWGDMIEVGQKLIISNSTSNTISRSFMEKNLTSEEIYLLARAVYGEARGESYSGQVAVAAVILNRLESEDFPNTIAGVIFEPWAFTAVNDGQFWLTPNATALAAARDAVRGNDPTGGALYYWNPETATNKWIWSRPIITQIGKHVFAY